MNLQRNVRSSRRRISDRMLVRLLIAILGCGTPLLWSSIDWRGYLQVNMPMTLVLLAWDWWQARKLDVIEGHALGSSKAPGPFAGPRVDLHPAVSPCKLPNELLAEPPRFLRDLMPGETAFVWFTAVVIDQNRNCYVRAGEELQPLPTLNTIAIKRTIDGVEVTLNADCRYTPQELRSSDLIPVIAVP